MNKNSTLLSAWLMFLMIASAVHPRISRATEVSSATKDFLAQTIGQSREQRLELARATIDSTDAAIEKQPMQADQRLLQVAALGAAARASTLTQSLKERYGSRSKAAVNDLLSIAPEEPWALFFAGLWNLEVERRGGVLGAALLGGSFETGEQLVAQAMEMQPDEPSFHFAYAVVLVSIDAKMHADRARELFGEMAQLVSARGGDHALYPAIEAHARSISAQLETERFDEARALALDLM